MNTLEKLQDEAYKEGVDIIEKPFESNRIKGLYCDSVIALSSDIKTSAEKACVLAEELGHHYTSTGDILDLSVVTNRKQERAARLWAYNHMIGLRRLIDAFEHGCSNRHEIASYLDVTEEFLIEALNCYREKYGVYTVVDNYVVYFEPLGVGLLKKHPKARGFSTLVVPNTVAKNLNCISSYYKL